MWDADDELFVQLADEGETIYHSIRQWTEWEGERNVQLRHYFQFLAWPDRDEPTAYERWSHMCDRIRHHFNNAPVGYYGFEFIPQDARANSARQRTFANLNNLRPAILSSIYESMLHSQDSLILEGFMVKVGDIGLNMRNATEVRAREPLLGGTGSSSPHGQKLIPVDLKGMGLACHPREDQADPARLALHCGPRALLMAKQAQTYLDPHRKYRTSKWIDQLLTDAETLAAQIGAEGGKMGLHHLERVLGLEGWKDLRIVIFNFAKKIIMNQAGEEWTWPADQDRQRPDPKTLHIFLHQIGTGHYWWIQYMKRFFCRINKDDRYTTCFACFTLMSTDELARHECSLAGSTIYQCSICRLIYTSKEGLEFHKSHGQEYAPCEACGRTRFNGPDCYGSHLNNNCQAPELRNGATWNICPLCARPCRSDMDHRCDDFGECSNCHHEFTDTPDKKQHRCCLQPLETYWDPVKTKADKNTGDIKPVAFTPHWAYDFETNRGLQLAPQVFRHEVMAWALYLMIPDDASRAFMHQVGFKLKTYEQVQQAGAIHSDIGLVPMPNDDDRILIYGKHLVSFIYVTEHVLVTSIKKVAIKPVLWAHNGSKFDAKFVLDYYLNVVRLDLAGDKYEEDYGNRRMPCVIDHQKEEGGKRIQWKKQKFSRRKDVARISNVGSKILQLKVRGLTYRCSHAHHTTALRNLPSTFGLKDLVQKGEFPYALLRLENWGLKLKGLPSLKAYDVQSMEGGRRLEVAEWWVEEQKRHHVKRDIIVDGLRDAGVTEIEVGEYVPAEEQVKEWEFTQELWDYLFKDVIVLGSCMEAYHLKALELHRDIWTSHPDRDGVMVSPLDCSTAPGFALRMYRTWFMPPDKMVILNPDEARFVRDALRGGRTDKRANYVELLAERMRKGDTMAYVDFVSLYPSVMDCDVHGTHFPVGVPSREVWACETNNQDLMRRMGDRTGFLRVSTKCLKYVTHPTLHKKAKVGERGEEKLVFANEDLQRETFAWPELCEAIRCGEIEVTHVSEVLLFERGTELFQEYIRFFFAIKDKAGKEKNAGLKSLAKLLLNSLWGKLGQRSYAIREWVVDAARLDYLFRKFELNDFRLLRYVDREADRAWFEYEVPDDVANLNSTAVHVAAFVSMWGRVVLHQKILSIHGQRALYSDTDSAIIYLRAGDVIQGLGNNIGELQNEIESILEKAGKKRGVDFVAPVIKEAVFVAPKTYALRIVCPETKLQYDKVVCKGFEPSFSNRQEIHFDAMKDLVWSENNLSDFVGSKRGLDAVERTFGKRRYIEDRGRTTFVSSWDQITPTEKYVKKKMYGKYDKGVTMDHQKRLVRPHGTWEPPIETFLDFVDNKHFE